MDYLAVGIAGFLGAVTRAFLGKVMAGVSLLFPVSTLAINVTGCFVLSFFLNITIERLHINPRLRLAVGTGFMGAYTTFSTFAVESVDLMKAGSAWFSVLYIVATAFGCVAFAWVGMGASRLAAGRDSDDAGKTETSEEDERVVE